jgi:NAD+ kinase
MGWDGEEDGETKRPKHISFEDGSLDGSDEDEGAVEVSVLSY